MPLAEPDCVDLLLPDEAPCWLDCPLLADPDESVAAEEPEEVDDVSGDEVPWVPAALLAPDDDVC